MARRTELASNGGQAIPRRRVDIRIQKAAKCPDGSGFLEPQPYSASWFAAPKEIAFAQYMGYRDWANTPLLNAWNFVVHSFPD